jgi:hypothetical protein
MSALFKFKPMFGPAGAMRLCDIECDLGLEEDWSVVLSTMALYWWSEMVLVMVSKLRVESYYICSCYVGAEGVFLC